MIRIGVAQWCLDSNGVDAIYKAARSGLVAIQLEFGDAGEQYLLTEKTTQRTYLEAAKKNNVIITGIAVNALNSYGMKSPVGSLNHKRSWEFIQRSIDAASFMGIALVFLPSFESGEICTDQDLERTAKMLEDACEYAEKNNVLIATENTLGVTGNLNLLSAVNHPNCRVLIDTLNPVLWGHDTSELIQNLWPYLCDQIHAKDGINGVMGNATLNTGQANITKIADVLRALGFSGYIILENEYNQFANTSISDDIAVLNQVFGEV